MRDVLRLPLQRLPAFLQHRKLRQQQLALFFQILLQRRLVGKALQQFPGLILGKRGDFRIDGVDARAQLGNARLQRIAVGECLARRGEDATLQLRQNPFHLRHILAFVRLPQRFEERFRLHLEFRRHPVGMAKLTGAAVRLFQPRFFVGIQLGGGRFGGLRGF